MLQINRKAPEIMKALEGAPIYRKQGIVEARPAVPGEVVQTLIRGKEETTKTAAENEMLVKNPNGEKYLISLQEFEKRYTRTQLIGEHADQGFSVYEAKGLIRAIDNPFGEEIEIEPEWGGVQVAGADCKIADILYENGELKGEPYLIDGESFASTYRELVSQ